MELEGLLKEKQDVIAFLTASSLDPSQPSRTSSIAVPHTPSQTVSAPATENFNNIGASGYRGSSIMDDNLSVFEVFDDLVGSIPTELGD